MKRIAYNNVDTKATYSTFRGVRSTLFAHEIERLLIWLYDPLAKIDYLPIASNAALISFRR